MAKDNKISGAQPAPSGTSTFNQPHNLPSTQVNVAGDATLNLPSEELVRQISEALKPVRKPTSTDPRRKALIDIENEFSGSVKDLHLHYIVPRVQDFNPLEEANSPTLSGSQESAFEFFDRFVSRPNLSNSNGHHCLFVLGDAGMGKTSLLVMLKYRHLAGGFRTPHDCCLIKLGRDTLARIEEIENKENTILLLDSLDEDPVAHEREAGPKERLRDLLPRLARFHAAIITCRTQFFPEKSSQFARLGHFRIDPFECPLKYLSLFDDHQVEGYLRKRFRPSLAGRISQAMAFGRIENPKLDEARRAAGSMDSLRMRPLLLSYIDDFVTEEGRVGIDLWNCYEVHERLVEQWLRRDAIHKLHGMTIQEGWRVATLLALHMARRGVAQLSRAELEAIPGLEDVPKFKIEARSLVNRTSDGRLQFADSSIQEFLIARAVLFDEPGYEVRGLSLSRSAYRFLKYGRKHHGCNSGLRGSIPDSADAKSALIVTALPAEYQAVRRHLNLLKETVHLKGTVYETGQFEAGDGEIWEVAIAQSGAGNLAAAQATERGLYHFKPKVALFVGVAGGIKDVALCDVVAAMKVYGYESGKQKEVLEPTPSVGICSHALVERAKAEAKKDRWRDRIKNNLPREPQALVGAIASGEKVLAAREGTFFKFLRENYGDSLAVEMEGRGFLEATHANAGVLALVVRGISDLIESKTKSDQAGYQEFACASASAFAFEVLANLDPNTLADTMDNQEDSAGKPRPTHVTFNPSNQSVGSQINTAVDGHVTIHAAGGPPVGVGKGKSDEEKETPQTPPSEGAKAVTALKLGLETVPPPLEPSFIQAFGSNRLHMLAIVFTDIIGSTILNNQYGDGPWGKVIDAHFLRATELIGSNHGWKIKTIGDAVMAVFRNSIDALNFAVQFEKDPGHEAIRIRAGVHSGQMRVVGGDTFGGEVNFAARVGAKAERGGIWVSNRVHEDWIGHDPGAVLPWVDKGEVVLEGFKDKHRLWSLPPTGSTPKDRLEEEPVVSGAPPQCDGLCDLFQGLLAKVRPILERNKGLADELIAALGYTVPPKVDKAEALFRSVIGRRAANALNMICSWLDPQDFRNDVPDLRILIHCVSALAVHDHEWLCKVRQQLSAESPGIFAVQPVIDASCMELVMACMLDRPTEFIVSEDGRMIVGKSFQSVQNIVDLASGSDVIDSRFRDLIKQLINLLQLQDTGKHEVNLSLVGQRLTALKNRRRPVYTNMDPEDKLLLILNANLKHFLILCRDQQASGAVEAAGEIPVYLGDIFAKLKEMESNARQRPRSS